MDEMNLTSSMEQLDENIDDLEEALEPILNSALSDAAGKLPLLDRAKLYVLITYSIESLLFSYLRLHGSNAKAHPVFRELTRVKQYFEKIKIAESKDQGRTGPTIDKPAAGRFIKHALAANNILDARKSQHHTAEKSHIRFDQTSNQLGAVDMVQSVVNTKGKDGSPTIKRKHNASASGESLTELDTLIPSGHSHDDNPSQKMLGKKRRVKR